MKRLKWRHIYNVLRTIVVTAIVGVVVLYALLYILLCIPAVQQKIKAEGEKQLSELLKTDVTIGELSIKPFNQLILYDVSVPDQQHHDLLKIATLGAGIDMQRLISDRKIVVSYAEIVGLQGHITKANPSSPTNMQFLIDAFKPKGDRPPKKFDLEIRNVVIRNSSVAFDVLSEPVLSGKFDKNHIAVRNFRADVELPRVKNDDFIILVKRLSAEEKSGLVLKHLSANVALEKTRATFTDVTIELPGTVIAPNDQTVDYDSLKHIGNALKSMPLNVHLRDAVITPSDFKALVPALGKFDEKINLTCDVTGGMKQLNVGSLKLAKESKSLTLDMKGTFRNLDNKKAISYQVPSLALKASAGDVSDILSLVKLKPNVARMVTSLGNVEVDGKVAGNMSGAQFGGQVGTGLGHVKLDARFSKSPSGEINVEGDVDTPNFMLGTLLGKTNLFGAVSAKAYVKAMLQQNKLKDATVIGNVKYFDYKGYRFQNIDANMTGGNNSYKGFVVVNDPNGKIDLNADVLLQGAQSRLNIDMVADHVNLSRMKLYGNSGNVFTFNLHTALTGNNLNNVNGDLNISNLSYVAPNGKEYHLNGLDMKASNNSYPQQITLNSDFLRGTISGRYDMKTLVPAMKSLLAHAAPDYFGQYADYDIANSNNDFTFNFEVEPNEQFSNLVKLPVRILYKANIDGHVNMPEKDIDVKVDVPYILQGKNLIEGTQLTAKYDNTLDAFLLNARTLIPSKNGRITAVLKAVGANGQINTDLGYKYERKHDYHGNLLMTTVLSKDENRALTAHVDINPSEVVANDTVWNVERGTVDYARGTVDLDIHAQRPGQFIDIAGRASKNPDDEIVLQLKDIDLDYVFEALHINNVEFGGRATGSFYVSDVFSKAPRLETPDLHVAGIKYNKAVMGDADIESHWDNEEKAFAINAKIAQSNGRTSVIGGSIFPTKDSLYIDFKADKANVKFMKPFMEAFTSDIDGIVSGHAVLFGNFHDIDLYGDVYAENLKLKLDFSNVYYHCTDSIHMRPGLISFSNVKLLDRDNHSANLSGWVKHDHFHNPSFNFTIKDAKDMLCYDTNSSINPVWYGAIYGNGSAFVDGEPGIVNIKVNMESAPRSKFTFVLSDSEEASNYHFITYRDRDVLNAPPAPEEEADTIPEVVKEYRKKVEKTNKSVPTNYVIDLEGDINDGMQIVLVMDPVGGDAVNATGNGNLKMKWDNNEKRLDMYGKYVLQAGSYHFTLQDIILKDFSIKEGSTISFQGDPYKAMLDLEAVYALNANIRDLDESFASDRELNRTNVPVHALLKAKGEISEPDIAFDLEFPTLTSDAYRKVKSIISTDDMMNRQIIYLLALNRFYTPEYMNASSSNNELSSIASSTISSQLSNILGRLNEKWSISPNFRTNKGDFSDTEFDLALSSTLLNNRLRFNGNFGYRDNTYNTKNSNFIGDFDIEYLLNSKGSWLLKAYNHFNDQNYYIRNAKTTQGVGVVFKHDFNRWFDFMKKKKPAESKKEAVATPEIDAVKPDEEKKK